MNGAQVLVEMLIRYDTHVLFGLPGDTSIDLYDALHAASDRITHIMARDERSAAFMADVYARLSGKPGICEGPSGGGATYLLPGIVEANGSAIPMIALTTDNPVDYEAQGALTDLAQSQIYSPVTKWSATLNNADMVPRFIRRAFRLATSGRPGAVHVALPKDVLSSDISVAISMHAEERCKTCPSMRTRSDAENIKNAAARLLRCQRPVIVAGGGVVSSRAHEELLALAHHLSIPVATTINGKGAIAETLPLSLGVVGANGARPYANQVVQEADLVLFVGSKINYVDTDSWRVPDLANSPTLIQIDVDPAEIGNNYPVDEGICADARMALSDLLQAVKKVQEEPLERNSWLNHIARLKAKWEADIRHSALGSSLPIMPQRVIYEMQRLLPQETVIVCDPGTPTPYVASQLQLPRPGRWTIFPRAQGGLGYAVPGVVGARLAKPDLPIVGLCGDGSFAIAAGDLATVARIGGPTVIILFNNGCYGWIKALQKLHCDERYFSVDFPESLSYVHVAEGFGVSGVRVTNPEEIGPTLGQALSHGSPFLIEIVTAAEQEAIPPPPVAPWQRILTGTAPQ